MRGRPADRTVAGMNYRTVRPIDSGTPGRMGGRSPPASSCRLGRGRARPRGARAVRRQGALGRRLGGAGLGVGQARRAIESHFPGQGTYALSVVVAGGRAGIGDRPMRAALAGVQRVLRGDRGRERSARAAAGGHRLARPPHRDRHRARGRGAVGDGRGGRAAEGPPRRAVGLRASPCASPARPRCGRTSTTPTRPR